MANNTVFQAGAGIHDFDSGLKPSLVCGNLSLKEVNAQLEPCFKYNHVPEENETQAMAFFEPCSSRHGGVCQADEFVGCLDTLVRNLHITTRDWKNVFPVLLQFVCGPIHEWALLGRLIGNGKLSMLTPVALETNSDGRPYAAEILIETLPSRGPASIPQVSHQLFRRMLVNWQHAQGVDFHEKDSLVMARWNFENDVFSDHFRVLLTGEHSYTILSCKEALPFRPKPDASENEVGMFNLTTPAKSRGQSASRSMKCSSKVEKKIDAQFSDFNGDSSESDDDVRSWSSATDVEPEPPRAVEPVVAVEPEPPPDELVVAVEPPWPAVDNSRWTTAGLKKWEVSPSSRGMCFICERRLAKGTFRLEYRTKPSFQLSDERRLHPACASQLPHATREADKATISQWLEETTVPVDAKDMLAEVLSSL